MSDSQQVSNELLAASVAGDDETITRLLQQGASVLSEDVNGDTGLHVSAQHGHDNIAKVFLDHEINVNIQGWENMTPLIRAAEYGHLTTTRLLIDRGAGLVLRDSDGRTALDHAAGMDYPDIVSEILTRGARQDVTNNDDETALQEAVKFGSFEVINFFAAWKNSEIRDEKLFEASNGGKTRLVRGLLIAGSSYEFRNAGNDQAIHKAALGLGGHPEVVRLLLEAGADITSRGQAGATPLTWAAITGQLNTARYLLDSGAEIDTRDDDGLTALHWATMNNHLSLVCELLDRKADKSIRKNEATSLDLAHESNYKDIAFLLDDSEISSDDKCQAKVLLLATQNANANVVADLIKRGARIDHIKSPVGETLVQLATRLPQMMKQEYDQEVIASAKTGLKPKDTLENVVQKAANKSNALAKIFISQKLSRHDQENITRRIADISDHSKAEHSDASVMLDKENKF